MSSRTQKMLELAKVVFEEGRELNNSDSDCLMQPLKEPSGEKMSQIIEEELINLPTISMPDLGDHSIDEFADIITSVNQNEAENERVLIVGNISNLEFHDNSNYKNGVNETEANKEPSGNETNSELEKNEENEEPTLKRKRSFNNKEKEDRWDQLKNKKEREQGVKYKGKKKRGSEWDYSVEKPARFISAPCSCKLGQKTTKLKCQTLSEEMRQRLYNKFWSKMSWKEKKMYVKGLVQVEGVKRRRGRQEGPSRRDFSMKYFLKNGVQLVRVCKKMFAGTLGLKERGIVNWVREDYLQEPQERENINKKSESRQKIYQERTSGVEKFLKSLPTVESHYCRSSSTRRYLEPIWRSKSHVYHFYKNEYCKEKKNTSSIGCEIFKYNAENEHVSV